MFFAGLITCSISCGLLLVFLVSGKHEKYYVPLVVLFFIGLAIAAFVAFGQDVPVRGSLTPGVFIKIYFDILTLNDHNYFY